MLEHLALDDLRPALRKTHDHLSHDGRFRLVMPDLERLASAYLRDSSSHAAYVFMRNARLGTETRATPAKALVNAVIGERGHLWMWDFAALRSELTRAGFVGIRRAEFGDSEETRFSEVEERARWTGTLGIECLKRG